MNAGHRYLGRALDVRLTHCGLTAAPGISVGVGAARSGVFVFGCGAATGIRLDFDEHPADPEGLEDLLKEVVQRLHDEGLLATTVTADVCACHDPMAASTAEGAAVLTFAGRCLFIPDHGDPRRLAVTRFLAGGNGREIASQLMREEAVVVAASVPDGYAAPAGGAEFQVFERGAWVDAEVGGLAGPLGTASTLRTWLSGGQWVSTAACQPRLNSPAGTTPPVGGSVGADADHTRLLAQAEACERYLGGCIEADRLVTGSLVDLGPDAIDPRTIVDFSPWQFDHFTHLEPFDGERPRLWVDVEDASGRARWMLADLVFYPFGWGQHTRQASTSSSGMAAHTSSDEAEFLALAELVERDAFMRLWLADGVGRNLVGWRDAADPKLLRALEDAKWLCRVVQIGVSRLEPVVLAIARRGRSVALGASAAHPITAVRKAVKEMWATTTRLTEAETAAPQSKFDVRSPADHGLYGLAGRWERLPRFVDNVDGEVDIDELADCPTFPEERFSYRWGPHLSRPFRVVRVIAPSLIPISFGFGQEPYGRADVREIVGVVPPSLRECPDPHLFP